MVSVTPQRGWVYPTLINLQVFFSDILATASRLSTLYGLETLHVQSSRHLGITQQVLGISEIFDVFMTSLVLDFFVILQFLATASDIKCFETLDLTCFTSPIIMKFYQ